MGSWIKQQNRSIPKKSIYTKSTYERPLTLQFRMLLASFDLCKFINLWFSTKDSCLISNTILSSPSHLPLPTPISHLSVSLKPPFLSFHQIRDESYSINFPSSNHKNISLNQTIKPSYSRTIKLSFNHVCFCPNQQHESRSKLFSSITSSSNHKQQTSNDFS